MTLKRLFDVTVSVVCLAAALPLLALAAVGIRLSDRGPVTFRARRVGLGGHTFVMHKLRTMRTHQGARPSAISGARDPRVFPFGALLRLLKIDELPQLYDVLRGRMSLVGPRPEDPRIVRDHYGVDGLATLAVRPGLTSPGSLYYYTHGERLLTGADTEAFYAERLLPTKLALDRQYVREASFIYDLRLLARTAAILATRAAGRTQFPEPPELKRLRGTRAEGDARAFGGDGRKVEV